MKIKLKNIIAILAVLALGIFAVITAKWIDSNENKATGIVVSDEPIPLILINYNQKGGTPDYFGRIQNFADPSNKAIITAGKKGVDWDIVTSEVEYQGKLVNVTYMSIFGDLNITMQKASFYPDRIDFNFVGFIAEIGDEFSIILGKQKYGILVINSSKISKPDFLTIWLNTTEGEINLNITNVTFENITSVFGGYINLIIDSMTGNISLQIRDLNNCSAIDNVYHKNIGPFKFIKSEGDGEVKVIMHNSGDFKETVINVGVFQNPISGQYESLNAEYCNILNKRPLG